jgi:hypothetical protein
MFHGFLDAFVRTGGIGFLWHYTEILQFVGWHSGWDKEILKADQRLLLLVKGFILT